MSSKTRAPPHLPYPASGALQARVSSSTLPAGRACADLLTRAYGGGRGLRPHHAPPSLDSAIASATVYDLPTIARRLPQGIAPTVTGTVHRNGLRLDAWPHRIAVGNRRPPLAGSPPDSGQEFMESISVTPSRKDCHLSGSRHGNAVHQNFFDGGVTTAFIQAVTKLYRTCKTNTTTSRWTSSATKSLPSPPRPAKLKLGRPKKADALTDAERAKRYRARKKSRLADLQDESIPVSSAVIDLSALPPWKRR